MGQRVYPKKEDTDFLARNPTFSSSFKKFVFELSRTAHVVRAPPNRSIGCRNQLLGEEEWEFRQTEKTDSRAGLRKRFFFDFGVSSSLVLYKKKPRRLHKNQLFSRICFFCFCEFSLFAREKHSVRKRAFGGGFGLPEGLLIPGAGQACKAEIRGSSGSYLEILTIRTSASVNTLSRTRFSSVDHLEPE